MNGQDSDSDEKTPDSQKVYELNDEQKRSPVREGSDRRSIDFYQHYTEEELKKMPRNRRQGDRRQDVDESGQ